jgi:hypothetical protein
MGLDHLAIGLGLPRYAFSTIKTSFEPAWHHPRPASPPAGLRNLEIDSYDRSGRSGRSIALVARVDLVTPLRDKRPSKPGTNVLYTRSPARSKVPRRSDPREVAYRKQED